VIKIILLHRRIRPQRPEQFLFGHKTAGALDQKSKCGKHLAAQRDNTALRNQAVLTDVQFKWTEPEYVRVHACDCQKNVRKLQLFPKDTNAFIMM